MSTMIEEFQAGVTAVLRSWSALRTAVESGWGGGARESQKKADDLRQNIFQAFDGTKFPPPNMDILDLSDNLAIFLEEEFSVTLEDKSEVQVAEAIFNMYENCHNGDPTFARQMVAHAESAIGFNSQFPVQLQTTEHDDDDDEDMGDSQEAATAPIISPANPTMSASEYLAQPLFGPPIKAKPVSNEPVRQLGESAPVAAPTIEMDDDGFAPVKPKGRRRN